MDYYLFIYLLYVQERIDCQKTCLSILYFYPAHMIHHLMEATEEGGYGDFMYCHSSLASRELLHVRNQNIGLAEDLKIGGEFLEENMNYVNMTEEERCKGSQELVEKLTSIMKEQLKCILKVVKEYPKIYGRGVHKIFVEYLEQEIRMLEENASWDELDEAEKKNVILGNEKCKDFDKKEDFDTFFYEICENIFKLDEQERGANLKSMDMETYISPYRTRSRDYCKPSQPQSHIPGAGWALAMGFGALSC